VTNLLNAIADLDTSELDQMALLDAEITPEELAAFDRFAAENRRPITFAAMFGALEQLAYDGSLPTRDSVRAEGSVRADVKVAPRAA
jgi:hypothetical protein